jgi:ferredoxin
MPILTVVTDNTPRELSFTPGQSVRALLEIGDIPIRSGCRGNGACGLCLIRIESGAVNELTRNERLQLSPEQVDRSIRLACQVMPVSNLCVSILALNPTSPWQDLINDGVLVPSPFPGDPCDKPTAEPGLGVAIDLGILPLLLVCAVGLDQIHNRWLGPMW